MIQEAIILAGGLGTRLREVVTDIPKCLAPVAGKPFLNYLIQDLLQQGVNRLVFAAGYKHELIEAYMAENYRQLNYTILVEKELLGTGGAIRSCCPAIHGNQALVLNGDTLFRVPLEELTAVHTRNSAICTLALKPMQQFDRYGAVRVNDRQQIIAFEEKQFREYGLINGGVYALNIPQFIDWMPEGVSSFEKAFLEPQAAAGNLAACISDTYFIDIGIPADYEKAQLDFQQFSS